MSELGSTAERLTRTVAKGSGIVFAGTLFGKAAGFLLHIMLGQMLGASSYGLYALGLSVFRIARVVAGLGLVEGILRFGALYRGENDNARVRGTVFSAIGASCMTSAVLGALLVTSAHHLSARVFHKPGLAIVLRLFGLALPFYVFMAMTAASLHSFQLMRYTTALRHVFPSLGGFILTCIAFVWGCHLKGAVWGFLGAGILGALWSVCLLWKGVLVETRTSRGPVYEPRELLRFSLPTFFIAVSQLLLSYTDRIILGRLGGADDVGVYNAATATAVQLTFFFEILVASFAPLIADLYHQGERRELQRLYATTTKWIFSLTLPLLLMYVSFPNRIMALFGSEFGAGGELLILLSLSQFVVVATGPTGLLLRMTGNQDIDFLNTLTVVFVNLGLNVFLVRLYGARGAAVATALSLIFVQLARLVEVHWLLKVFPYDSRYLKPVAAAVGGMMGGALLDMFVAQGHFLGYLRGIVILVIYAAVLCLLGFDGEDRAVFSAASRLVLAKLAGRAR
jgi:O-antigen/teichoic acid export membrane protein